jgi:putative cardiolipin synthase
LHAKLYTIDGERVFLGSINLDPRSKVVNTEVGMLIADAGFARQATIAIEQLMTPDNAWRVELDDERRLVWTNDRESTRRQPARNVGQRIADRVFRLLPLDRYI